MTLEVGKVTLEGPFFRRDPGKTLRANVRDLNTALAAEGEQQIASTIGSHIALDPRYVRGRTESVTGKVWGTWARVSPDTRGLDAPAAIRLMAILAGRHDGIGSDQRNRGTTKGVEGQWHPFRKAKSDVYRMRALLTADLTKGLD